MRGSLAQRGAELPPGSFAFVMATGIVSIAAGLDGLRWVALPLFGLNLLAFAALWLALALRLWDQPGSVARLLADHRQAPVLLTIVAGTCVVGNQLSVLAGEGIVAAALWLLGGALWAALVYGALALLTMQPEKPKLEAGIDGSALLLVVATEALAILGTHTAATLPGRQTVVLISFALFLLGSVFYVLLLALIVQRWLFLPMQPDDFAPAYWINMGAAAITALAGARLLPVLAVSAGLAGARGFVIAATLLFWSVASWWIPLLVVLTVWRHRAFPLAYATENWAIVFPLGMYTTASSAVADAIGLPSLTIVPEIFVWVAIAAWALTFLGLVRLVVRQRPA